MIKLCVVVGGIVDFSMIRLLGCRVGMRVWVVVFMYWRLG